MSKRKLIPMAFVIATLALFSSCLGQNKDHRPVVLIKTEFGNMKIELYNETPKHRDNFLKLAKEGYYNGQLFHRVINEFMIQGGDPNSRGAQPGVKLGNGGPGYTIDAEINPKFLHKKGALAAARQGDNINPEKKSSGSQFYIVQGIVFPDNNFEELENAGNEKLRQSFVRQLMAANEDSLKIYQEKNDQAAIQSILERVQIQSAEKVKQNPFKLTDEQREIYTHRGGTPHLDGGYTVFGEVVDGFDVIDAIAKQPTDPNSRPINDVKFEVEVLTE